MNWTEITIKVNNADTDEAAAIANMTVPYGIYIEDYSDLEQGAREIAHIDLIDEELLAKNRNISIIHIYFSEEDKERYARILKKADEVVLLSDHYYNGCMQNRDRYMVDRADALIAYCRKEEGGAAYTVKYFLKTKNEENIIYV